MLRFSIFIPVWNGAQWLAGAIESVFAQTYPHWELVIGDNASSDNLAAIAGRYVDPRLRYHRWSTHTNIYENYNRTMQLCRYEWIQLLCVDDRLDPRCLEQMSARILEVSGRTARLGMVVTAARRIDANGRSADAAYYGYSGRKAVPDGLYDGRAWLRWAAAPGTTPWNFGSVAISRELLAELGCFFRPEIGMCSDQELLLRVSAYADVAYIDEPLLDYTVTPESDSNKREARHLARGDKLTPMAAALLAGLGVHETRRELLRAERLEVHAAVARSYLQRASQHRLRSGGRGRRGALVDIVRAAVHSPRTVFSPEYLAYAAATLLTPIALLRKGRAGLISRKYMASRAATANNLEPQIGGDSTK